MKLISVSLGKCLFTLAMLSMAKTNAQQNVGIGATLPTEARLVVTGGAGGGEALFGKGVSGIALESSPASVNFNNYYNNDGRKRSSTGFAAQFNYAADVGTLTFRGSAASGSGNTAVTLTETLLYLNSTGLMGLGTNTGMGMITTRGRVGAVAALFGDNTTGVAIENSYPGIGLNTYYNGSRKFIASGYGSLISQDPLVGDFAVYSSPTSGIINNAANLALRMMINKDGQVGIGAANPAFRLDINGRTRIRSGGEGAGLWFNKNDETQGSFIGTYDATNFGIWGPGAVGSWKYLFDVNDGVMRIGTTQKATGYLLNVGGKIIAEEVRVTLQAAWPDYVFAPSYHLMPLEDLEKHILQNQHLPNIPNASTMQSEGIALGTMQTKMMEKIEELSLYIIDLNKKLKAQSEEILLLKAERK
jgi:hypothetical protein